MTDHPSLPEHDPNRQAAFLLRALAIAQHELADLASRLRERPNVRSVSRELDVYGHSDDFSTTPQGIASWYVEPEFNDGTFRTYNLSLYHDGEAWVIDAEITEPGRYGPESLKRFPTRTASDIRGCVGELSLALEQLKAAADEEREFENPKRPHN